MATKSSSNAVRVKTTTIEAAIKKLEAAPEKQKDEHTLRESIELMKDAIKGILERGYTYDEVAAMLTASDVTISGVTLKQYMSAMNRKKKPTKASGRKPKSASSSQETTDTSASNRSVQVSEDKDPKGIVENPSTDQPSSKELARMAKTATPKAKKSNDAESEFNVY